MAGPLRGLLVIAALALPSLGAPRPAVAEPQPPNEPGATTAEQLAARAEFQEGSRRAQSGDWDGALTRYGASQARFPHATTLYNIGYCHERLGDFAAAARDTQNALLFENRFPERGLSEELRARAQAALGELAQKVSRVELDARADELALRVDGRALELVVVDELTVGFVAGADTEPSWSPVQSGLVLTLNPGTHVLEWRTAGGTSSQELALRSGETVRLTVPEAPLGGPVARAHQTSPPPSAKQRVVPKAAPAPSRPLRTFGIVAFAASGGAALAGLGAGLLAMSTNRDLKASCGADGACPLDQAERIEHFQTQTAIATVAFASAAVLAGAGVTLFLLDSSPSKSAALTLRVASEVTLTGHFR